MVFSCHSPFPCQFLKQSNGILLSLTVPVSIFKTILRYSSVNHCSRVNFLNNLMVFSCHSPFPCQFLKQSNGILLSLTVPVSIFKTILRYSSVNHCSRVNFLNNLMVFSCHSPFPCQFLKQSNGILLSLTVPVSIFKTILRYSSVNHCSRVNFLNNLMVFSCHSPFPCQFLKQSNGILLSLTVPVSIS